MKIMRNFTLLFVLNGLLICAACKKSDQAPIPKWFDNDAVFTYECSETDTPATSIVQLTARNTVVERSTWQSTYLEYRVELRQSLAQPELTWKGPYFENSNVGGFIKKNDGLYGSAPNTCGMGFFMTFSDFLAIPANPSTGQSVQLYRCESQPAGKNQILNADTVLTVPAGTFHTFCILHPDSSISYWNRDIGIIQFELYGRYRSPSLRKIATLKLKRDR